MPVILPNDERGQIILEALQPDSNLTEIARRRGVHRNTIYGYLRFVLDDPKGRMLDAEAEAAFRRKVWELVH
jgi:transposase-like protein